MRLPLTPSLYQRDLLSQPICHLVLRPASTLDAFRSYQVERSCPAMLCTTGIPEAPDPSSSRTHGYLLSSGDTSRRYYRTVSRRSEPSSCRSLMDEQPNLWRLLHRQDDLSRQRCTKPRGRYVLYCILADAYRKIPSREFRPPHGQNFRARREHVPAFRERNACTKT